MDLALNNLQWLISHKTQANILIKDYDKISKYKYLEIQIERNMAPLYA